MVSFVLMCFHLSYSTQFSTFEFDATFYEFIDHDWDSYFVFNPKDPRLKIYLEVYDSIVSILVCETLCSSSAASQIRWWVPTVLFFF